MKVKQVISFMILLVFLASCGGRTANPVAQYQYGDESKSCGALRMEMSQIQADIQRKISAEENTTGKNVALGVTGVFFIVPLFFMDLSDADKTEMEALRNRYNALARIAADKGCGFGYKKIVIGNPGDKDQSTDKKKLSETATKVKPGRKYTLAVISVAGNIDNKTRSEASNELYDGAIEAGKSIKNLHVVRANGPGQIGSLYDWGNANNIQAILYCKFTEEQNAGNYGEKVYRADLTLLDVEGFSKKEYSLLITYQEMGGAAQPEVKRMANCAVKEYLEIKTLKRIE